jgi:hypothetical protein
VSGRIRVCSGTVVAGALIVVLVIAVNTRCLLAARDGEMRLVFYGYVDRTVLGSLTACGHA